MRRLVLLFVLVHICKLQKADSSRVRGRYDRRRNDRRLFDPHIPTNIFSDFTTEALGRKSSKSKKGKCPKGSPKSGGPPPPNEVICDEGGSDPGPSYSFAPTPASWGSPGTPGGPAYSNPPAGPSGPGDGGYSPSGSPNTGGQNSPGIPATSIPVAIPTAIDTPSPVMTYTQAPAFANPPNAVPTVSPYGNAPPILTESPAAAPTAFPGNAVTSAPNSSPALTPTGDSKSTAECEAIANGTASTSYDYLSFSITFILVISESKDAVMNRLEDFLQTIMAPLLAGCLVDSGGRRLDAAEIQNVVFNVHEDDANCTTNIENATCIRSIADADVYYEGNDTSHLEGSLLLMVIDQCPKIRQLEGIVETFNPCKAIEIVQNTTGDSGRDAGGGVAAVQGSTDSESKVKPAGFVSLGIGLLLVIMLLFLFARRNSSEDGALKHQELDDFEDDTYLKDLDASSEASSWRPARVVGEDDSVGSGAPNDSSRQQNQKGGIGQHLPTQDVHMCSSATCETCERRRQLGLQFVPTGMPAHSGSSLPPNAQRQYYARDTVDL